MLKNLDNRRREISVKNVSNYLKDLGKAVELFETVREDELRNLLGE